MHRPVAVIGVPMDYGAGRRGVDMGPSAIRYAGLQKGLERLGYTVLDLGDLPVPPPETSELLRPDLKYLHEIVPVTQQLARRVASLLQEGKFPLVLGGDHAIAIGTLAGVAKASQAPAVIWFDTHGDFNTNETTPSGNIHGMPLAASVGRGAPELLEGRDGAPPIPEGRVVMVGVRELDPAERESLQNSDVTVFTMSDIDRMGMRTVMQKALGHLQGAGALHLSFDMDVMDPRIAPGVGTPHEGGITYREAHLAMELIYESRMLTSLELVEVNPILDIENRTGELAAELALSALGQRIL